MILQGKNIVLGVTGGIAAYKAVDLCSKLVQAGAHVDGARLCDTASVPDDHPATRVYRYVPFAG